MKAFGEPLSFLSQRSGKRGIFFWELIILFIMVWLSFNAIKTVKLPVEVGGNKSLVVPSCRLFDFPLVFRPFILLSVVLGLHAVLPPSSLFVLITSVEACPKIERQRDAGGERARCFHRRLLVFHFCHNGLFVYDNLSPTPCFKQGSVRLPRRKYVCSVALTPGVHTCVFPAMWEADSRASQLSAQPGCYGNHRGPTEVMKML